MLWIVGVYASLITVGEPDVAFVNASKYSSDFLRYSACRKLCFSVIVRKPSRAAGSSRRYDECTGFFRTLLSASSTAHLPPACFKAWIFRPAPAEPDVAAPPG